MSLESFPTLQATTHPFLDIAASQYGQQERAGNHYRFNPMSAMGTNWQESYSSGPSGYGPGTSGYEQPNYPPDHSDTSGYAGHSGGGGGTGYAAPYNHAPVHPPIHPPIHPPPTKSSLYLEHMNTMNPTVMVMTNNGVRNRANKLAEMNSREQSTSAAASIANDGHIVVEPEDIVAAAPAASVTPATIQAIYSSPPILESPHKLQNPYATAATVTSPHSPPTNSFDNNYDYANRTILSSTTTTTFSTNEKYQPQFHYEDRYHTPAPVSQPNHHLNFDAYAGNYDGANSNVFSHNRYEAPAHHGGSSYYGGSNVGAGGSGASGYYERDRYGDRYSDRYDDRYTRIN